MADFKPADWYRGITSADAPLLQGDQLLGATVRSVIPSEAPPGSWDVGFSTADVILATQSCDLEQRKVAQVEIIPTYPLGEWLSYQPHMMSELEAIRRGYSPGLYLLPGWPEAPMVGARLTRIVPFDEKLSMTWPELDAARVGQRIGLSSPYIEHFGQAVARFYMRVGLPENIPQINWEAIELDGGGTSRTLSLKVTVEEDGGRTPVDATLRATVERMRLIRAPDMVYRIRLERDSNYFGIGTSIEEATSSLRDRMVNKYRELASQLPMEKQKSNWLLSSFREK